MEFLLKKLISAILLPIPIVVILLILGMLLFWFVHRTRLTNRLLTLALIILILFSFNPLPTWMLAHLENQYAPLTKIPPAANTIVVLGGGVRDNTTAPPNTQLSSASLSRLIEAMRLYHQKPGSKIILSGGRVFGSLSESTTMNNLAVALGIPAQSLVIENGSRDTYEEALYLKRQLGDKPFILVTSAFHMPRAMAIFEKQGMQPIAAPTQFIAKQNARSAKYYFPNAVNLIHADIAIHEYIGLLWGKLTGHI